MAPAGGIRAPPGTCSSYEMLAFYTEYIHPKENNLLGQNIVPLIRICVCMM